MKTQKTWIACGQGTVTHPVSGRQITTEVVELKGFGRIGEWYDYSNDPEGNFRLILSAPDLLEACKYAAELIPIARRYFPKSIKRSDRFQLENVCATLGNAIAKAEGK